MPLELFYYECAGGHSWSAPYQFFECPAYVHGKACTGVVRRVGPGSKKENDGASRSV